MLSFKKLQHIGERGDTIVEVLISIAVVSLILGGAYVTTNNSLQGTRASQERSDSLKVAESQLEALKSMALSDPDTIFGSPTSTPFCISNGAVQSATNARCKVSAEGTQTTIEPAYNISITKNGNTFTIRNSWSGLKGKQERLNLTYKVYRND